MGLLSAAVPVVQEFVVRVGEREHTVRVDRGVAHVDGIAHTVTPSGGGRTLVTAPEVHRCVSLAGEPTPTHASIAGHAVDLEVRTAQAAALASAMSGGRAGARAGSQVKAPMPGRVVRILVSVGQSVERGQPIVIIEAMKMENEMHAPAAGVIKAIHAQQGAAVDAGQLLVELDLGGASA
jgi:glutaconyl-CoA/methylmalonyl-CoA decarboxylase subunit gamma